MRYDTIIFDCDGTLVDSELAYNTVACDLFAEYGLPRYSIDYALANWMGKAFDDIIRAEEIKNNVSLPAQEIIQKMVAMVPRYQEKYIKQIDGALDAVLNLKPHYKICVASNGELPNILSSLTLAGFDDAFDEARVFSKDQVQRAKPFPDLFLYACAQMNSDPARAIVVEDSVSGVRAGRAAGMYVIGFNGVGHNDLQSDTALMGAGANIVFSRWSDIVSHIKTLKKL